MGELGINPTFVIDIHAYQIGYSLLRNVQLLFSQYLLFIVRLQYTKTITLAKQGLKSFLCLYLIHLYLVALFVLVKHLSNFISSWYIERVIVDASL